MKTVATKEHSLLIPGDRVLNNARIVARGLPLCPEICLFLLSEDYPKEPVSRYEFDTTIASPPYWAFCWASGQALARFVLDNPRFVQGKTVLDFGAGSGIAAIAAAKAGAIAIVASDLDPAAQNAIKANAELNQVRVETCGRAALSQEDCEFEVILAGDVCYDAMNMALLCSLASRHLVIVADSRMKTFPEPLFAPAARLTLKTVPDIFEAEEFNHIVIYHSAFHGTSER